MNKKYLFIINAIVLLVVSLFFSYRANIQAYYLYYFALCIFFLFSSNNYLWIAFLFLIIEAPGGMFSSVLRNVRGVPTFALGSFTFPFIELSFLLMLVKSLFKGNFIRLFVFKNLKILFFYFIFLLFWSVILGQSIEQLGLLSIHLFLTYSLFLSIPSLLPKQHTIDRLFIVLSLFTFISFLLQLFELLLGIPIGAVLTNGSIEILGSHDYTRVIYSPFMALLTMILAFNYLFGKRTIEIPIVLLYLIIFISSFMLFLSATRGWIIATLIIFIFAFVGNMNKLSYFFSLLVLSIVILTVFFKYSDEVKLYSDLSVGRMQTIETLVEGDASANNTLIRLTQRSPRVLKKAFESPIFGFGFSSGYDKFFDPHVGNQNIFLNAGVIGFICFLLFWKAIVKNILLNRKVMFFNWNVFLGGFFAILFIHSTSTQLFGYTVGSFFEAFYLIALFLTIVNFYIKNKNAGLLSTTQ